MPELPEVETIRRDLARVLRGKKITGLTVRLPKQIKTSLARFRRAVIGATIADVRRRAKFLILDLQPAAESTAPAHLIFHLKMTGQLIYRAADSTLAGGGHPIKQDLQKLPNRYSHVIFKFADRGQLFFNDTRQFGFVKLATPDELKQLENIIGPEPLDKNFTLARLREILSAHPRWELKPALMEQKIIAGIGNIYASEICFAARLAPARRVVTLKPDDWLHLHQSITKILRLAIKNRGTSSDTYVDAFGRQGSMNRALKVYGRAGETCARCGSKSTIQPFRQKQRSTFHCPHCQK